MTVRSQFLFWLGAVAIVIAVTWLFRNMLLPFVLGAAIAYLLNPIVALLGRHQISRLPAVCLILGVFLLVIVVLIALIVPPLYREIVQLAAAAPEYVDTLWQRLQPHLGTLSAQIDVESLRQNLRSTIRESASDLLNISANLLRGLVSGGRAIMDFLALFVLTPLVAFLMLLDFEKVLAWFDELIPRHHYDTVHDLLTRIDAKIAGFIRGQLLVALALAGLYVITLSLAGLQFALLIGLGAGALSVIPLFGSTVGLITAVVTAWLQTGDFAYVGLIAAIFIGGQLLEGNVITPKLLGSSVGLHPLWILFALLAGGTFLGIVGMILAIPVASTVGVLVGFVLQQYKASGYYTHPPED